MGGARPEDFDAEAKRQGVLFKDGKASTQAVLDQEQRIIGFARAGKGTCRPLARAGMTGWPGCRMSRKPPCGMSGIRPTASC